MAGYAVHGIDHVLTWMPSAGPAEVEAVLSWIADHLVVDPIGAATTIRHGAARPAFTARVPATETFIDYVVLTALDPKVVLIRRCTTRRW